jgi:hypothetical protein
MQYVNYEKLFAWVGQVLPWLTILVQIEPMESKIVAAEKGNQLPLMAICCGDLQQQWHSLYFSLSERQKSSIEIIPVVVATSIALLGVGYKLTIALS